MNIFLMENMKKCWAISPFFPVKFKYGKVCQENVTAPSECVLIFDQCHRDAYISKVKSEAAKSRAEIQKQMTILKKHYMTIDGKNRILILEYVIITSWS